MRKKPMSRGTIFNCKIFKLELAGLMDFTC